MKKVLAIGAHADDLEFGCFGTLARHISEGDEVTLVIMSTSNVRDAHTNQVTRTATVSVEEAIQSAKLLEKAELVFGEFEDTKIPFDNRSVAFIERLIKWKNIDTIYTHWAGDTHQDHINTLSATMAAARLVPNVFCYEQVPLPRITTTYPVANYYVDVTKYMDTKIQGCNCHKSQVDKFSQHGFDIIDGIVTLSKFRGNQCGVKYAEAFNVLKQVR
jgi:LmbE family N-acetylglucosaminyl deacetylase